MVLQKLKMPFRNTCAACGAVIEQGAEVYAKDMNAVVSGSGICPKCLPEPEPVPVPFPAVASTEKQEAKPVELKRRKAKAS